MQMSKDRVVIVGGGLAGLACAIHLKSNGIPVQLFEAGTTLGGRVATDVVDGFLLDRGFQVLLTSYAEAKRMLDFRALQLHRFTPGAAIRRNGKFHRVVDPLRSPQFALQTATTELATVADKLLVAKMSVLSSNCDPNDPKLAGVSTADELRNIGFSEQFIESFFRPFFGGIFLEGNLKSNAAMFRYLFRMFSTGYATLPAGGMGAIARQLAAKLKPSEYRLGEPIECIDDDGVILKSGERVTASHVVIATDWAAAAKIFNRQSLRPSRSVSCLYFAADSLPSNLPILYLNGERDGIINNLCFPTTIAPTYAPAQQHLLSVSVLDDLTSSDLHIETEVRTELARWFGETASNWRHLRTYRIKHALPGQSPGIEPEFLNHRLNDRIFICGDYTEHASINGALLSGRRAAQALIQTLQTSAA